MMTQFQSNYMIQGIEVLLREDRILNRYHPLIACRHQLVEHLLMMGCKTRDDCLSLPDEALYEAGLPLGMAGLFRRFLRMYDYKGRGRKDIPDTHSRSPEEIASLLELMRLPGVKAVRAQLYYHCGLHSLADFAAADAAALQAHISGVIARDGLSCSVPLPKELRTQIAVAQVFTEYAAP